MSEEYEEKRQVVRRREDQCPLHSLCWDDNEKDHKRMGQVIDSIKVASDKAAAAFLPRWVFVSFIGLAVLIVGSGFGFFGKAMDRLADTIRINSDGTQKYMQEISNNQVLMIWRIEKLEEKIERKK
jgi:hypothetical protein